MLRNCAMAVLALLPLLGSVDPRVAENRARLESMTPAERNELARAQLRFESMTAKQRESVIALDDAIAASPDAEALRAVMRRYYDWLKDLPVEQRSELRMLEPQQRMALVSELVSRQRREASRSRIIDDFRKTVAWSEAYAHEHADEIAGLLSEREQAGLRQIPERFRSKRLSMELWKDWYGDEAAKHPLQISDWQPLVDQLSAESRAALRSDQPPVAQWQALLNYFAREIANTLPAESRAEVATMDRRDRMGLLMRFAMQSRWEAPEVSGVELREMFAELSKEERDRLIQLPPDEMARQLRYRFFREQAQERMQNLPGPPPQDGFRPHRGPRDEPWRGPRGEGPSRGGDRREFEGDRRGPRGPHMRTEPGEAPQDGPR